MTTMDEANRRGLQAVAEEMEDRGPERVGYDPHNDPRDPQPEQGPSVIGVEAGKAIALAWAAEQPRLPGAVDGYRGVLRDRT
jgi:hypothetical protein